MNDGVFLAVSNWVENAVIGLNLCPFAKREWASQKVRVKITDSSDSIDLLEDLAAELDILEGDENIETTLLVHPNTLVEFLDYNDFLCFADRLVEELGYLGVYQLASFHPDYQFANTPVDAAENFTNRAPYPMLHILREQSLERAIDSHPDTQKIPENNIRRVNQLGADYMKNLLKECYEQAGPRESI